MSNEFGFSPLSGWQICKSKTCLVFDTQTNFAPTLKNHVTIMLQYLLWYPTTSIEKNLHCPCGMGAVRRQKLGNFVIPISMTGQWSPGRWWPSSSKKKQQGWPTLCAGWAPRQSLMNQEGGDPAATEGWWHQGFTASRWGDPPSNPRGGGDTTPFILIFFPGSFESKKWTCFCDTGEKTA